MGKRITKKGFIDELREEDNNQVHEEIKKQMAKEGRFYTLDVELDIDRELEMDFENNFR